MSGAAVFAAVGGCCSAQALARAAARFLGAGVGAGAAAPGSVPACTTVNLVGLVRLGVLRAAGFGAWSVTAATAAREGRAPRGTGVEEIARGALVLDIVSAALKEGKSTIGRPFMDKKMAVPVFAVAVPDCKT